MPEPQPLDEEKFAELIEKARKEGKEEAKLILVTNEVSRQGDYCDITRTLSVVYGEAETVQLEKKCQPYPGVCETKIALIPLSVPAIVIAHEYDDCSNPETHSAVVYVFTGEEWKRIKIENLP